jgi:hypothetical protein
VLGNGRDKARSVDRKALESHLMTGLPERMMTRGIAAKAKRSIRMKPISSTASAEAHRIHPPELAEAARAVAKIVHVVEQCSWRRAMSDRLTELRVPKGQSHRPLTGRHSGARRKRGDLTRVKFGKKTLFYAADLAAFLARLRHLSESDQSQVDHGPR